MLVLVDTCQATASARGGLCACLEPDTLRRLRAVTADSGLAAGETVFAAGEAAPFLYGLRQGAVMLTRRMADGRRQVLSFLFPGDTFGFADGPVHVATAVTLQRSSFCRIPLVMPEADPFLAQRLRHIAQACLADAYHHALRLGRMTAAERVADFLFWLWTRLGRPEELHLPMRLVDIADHLGIRAETTSRAFSALRRAGLIGALSSDGILPIYQGAALTGRR